LWSIRPRRLQKKPTKEVAPLLAGSLSRQRNEPYLKVTPEQKAIVGTDHGPTKAIKRYSKDFDQTLKDSTVREESILKRITPEKEVWFEHGSE